MRFAGAKKPGNHRRGRVTFSKINFRRAFPFPGKPEAAKPAPEANRKRALRKVVPPRTMAGTITIAETGDSIASEPLMKMANG